MAELIPIYKGRDFYVPAFEVKIGGADVPKEVLHDVIEVRYTDAVDKFDTFELTINNWDEVNRDFKYTGSRLGIRDKKKRDELFDPGQEIELWMGYFSPIGAFARDKDKPEPLRLMLGGIITKLAPSFPSSGRPILKVSGQNALIKMINKQETYDYKAGMRDSEIAEKVGSRGNLMLGGMKIPVRIDRNAMSSEPPHPEPVLQKNQYDILFLLQLARRNGYDLVLMKEEKNGVTSFYLNFGPSTKVTPNYLLEWGKSLVQFEPTLKTDKQVNELTVRGWDINTKKEIVETVKRSDLKVRGMSDLDRLHRIEGGFQEKHEIVVDRPFHSKAEAKQFAKAKLEALAKTMVTAKGSTLGTPDLMSGRKVEIRGLGVTFDGSYYIQSTTHTLGSNGYTTEFEARMEEENR